jgi:quinoprotein dehydrogenase-associated probable ABC transporter substrate-binding protein
VKVRSRAAAARRRTIGHIAAYCVMIAVLLPVKSLGQANTAEGADTAGQANTIVGGGLELVDPKVLRVCADPNNLPFSNDKGEGFENKLGELFAAKLGKSLSYTYYPGATGFVRNTLGSYRCDVIMGFAQGSDLVQATNPYYRSAYALVTKSDSPLAEIQTLEDERLKDKRVGVVAGTPPASDFVTDGLMPYAKSYPLVVDTRYDSSVQAMINDINSGAVDAGVLWGPIAGYYASHANPPMRTTLLLKEKGGPHLDYRIVMGVRQSDQNWKRKLNQLIAENQPAINKIMLDYGVPLLNDNDQLITAADAPTQKP